MKSPDMNNWLEANQHYLDCKIDLLRHSLVEFTHKAAKKEQPSKGLAAARNRLQAVRESMPAPRQSKRWEKRSNYLPSKRTWCY